MHYFLDSSSTVSAEGGENCKQQEITVVQTVEISVLSKLLFLAGDVLSSKVQRK